jgi:peptide subunit release factor 1 (eRF1)
VEVVHLDQRKDQCDFMAIEYITTRDLKNSSGIVKGRVRILKLVEDSEATVNFKCPECGFEESRKEYWTEPFVVGTGKNQYFNLKCQKCDYKIKLTKLRKEIKKR